MCNDNRLIVAGPNGNGFPWHIMTTLGSLQPNLFSLKENRVHFQAVYIYLVSLFERIPLAINTTQYNSIYCDTRHRNT